MNFTDPKKMLDRIISKTDKDGDGINDEHEQKIEGKDVDPIPKQGFFKRAIRTARKTLAGETLAGRIGAAAKNVLKHIFPWGHQVDSLTDLIGDQLKTDKKTMANETIFQKAIRFLKQESTQNGIAVLVAIVGAVFSLDIDPEVLTSSLLGIVTGIAGAWVGVKSIIGIFKDEDA